MLFAICLLPFFISGIFYLNQVVYYPDHSVDLSIVFMLDGLVHFAETQRDQRVFLPFCFVNRAFDEGDFYLAHVLLSVIGYLLSVVLMLINH